MTFLCSPNNPTGLVEPAERVHELLAIAPGLVVVDEAYAQFADWSALSLVDEDRALVVVRTFSKTWSMAAARLGYLVGPSWLVAELEKVALPYHLDAAKQLAGRLALRFVDDMDARVELRRVTRAATDTYYKKGQFPTIDNTPATSCCSEDGNRCRGGFETPAWREIGFESFSSGRYRLGYKSTPKKFTAIAIGDSDCDGSEVTFTMDVDIVGGDPVPGMIQRSGID